MSRPHPLWHYEVFAQRLRVALAVSGISGAKLAREIGCTTQAVNLWTKGNRCPSSAHLAAICKTTGCSMEFLTCPEPVDVRSAPRAPDGKHIKEWVREVLAEMKT